jgi:methionyl-tRNA synthetase
MLMALGEPLPEKVYGHPWLLFGTDKMSKSKGNVIYADDLIEVFGVDAVRYYLLSEMPHANDGSITYESMIERYNSDLANTIGNLVSRTVAMVNKYFDGTLPCNTCSEPIDDEFKATILSALPAVEKAFDEFKIANAAEAVLNVAKRSNKYIDETYPWLLAKEEDKKDRLSTVLYNLVESIRILAVLLKPFIPATSDKILAAINTDIDDYESIKTFGAIPAGSSVATCEPLFARIDAQKFIDELIAKNEAQQEKEKKVIEGLAPISIDEFAKVELRVAKVKACEPIKKAKKLLKLTLDDGSGVDRTVASGIAQWYKPDDLIGRNVIVVANLQPATLCGVESKGMILAGGEDEVKVIFVDDIEVGTKIR